MLKFMLINIIFTMKVESMKEKNLIIIFLSVFVVGLSIYVFILKQKNEVKISEPIIKIITKEKIVYVTEPQKQELKNPQKKSIEEKVLRKSHIDNLPEVEVPLTKDNEYIISSTRDKNGRFSIALVSKLKPPKKAFYDKKIILHSQISDDKYKGDFLFLVPPSLLENLDDLNIKITDAISGKTYLETAYCFQGIESKYDYTMDISLYGGFNCYVQENGKAFEMPKPSAESVQRMQEVFKKLQKNNNSRE